MEISDLKNQLVGIFGYGQEGQATSKYLLKHGVKPVLFDQRTFQKFDSEQQSEIKKSGLNFIFGPDAFLEAKGFDVIFRSPGVKLNKIKNYLSKKTIITSQTIWFFRNCPAKIIGVTGTKGKGTTASLIHKILKANFKNTKIKNYLTGNIGQIQPFEILDKLQPIDYVTYELSSFQLQDLKTSPHIGVVLMTTSDHLDYHENLQEYLRAKSAITKYQSNKDFSVINQDFKNSKNIGNFGSGKKIFFSRQKQINPGVYFNENKIFVKNILGKNYEISVDGLRLKGLHNIENICAATAAALCAGCKKTIIQSTIKKYTGLKHRLQLVSIKAGISYFDDSFSTNPDTTIAAINSFHEPLILILGGSSKNSDFTELARTINNSANIKAIVAIGEEGKKIISLIKRKTITVLENASSMTEIFKQVRTVAKKGDVVLLSPACASFDMFKNYKDRGEQFIFHASR